MLQAFEFERDRPRRQAEVRQIHGNDWRMAQIGADQRLGFRDSLTGDRAVFRHGQMLPLPD
jgi:hypothetical protein